MLFVSHLVLVLLIISGMSYSRFQSEWVSQVEHMAQITKSHLFNHIKLISGFVAGRNHANLKVLHSGNYPHGVVTISMGAVLVAPRQNCLSDGECTVLLEKLFEIADKNLYMAKNNGRNSVMFNKQTSTEDNSHN